MSSSRLARARLVHGDAAESTAALLWPALSDQALTPFPSPAPEPEPPTSGGRAAGDPGTGRRACDCQEEVESVKRAMEAALDHARLTAHAEGVRQGEQRGRQQAASEVESVIARLLRTIEDLSATRDEFRREAEGDVVRLALGIARRVVHREVTIDSTVLLGVVRAALDKIGARELHRVLVSPGDRPTLAAGVESLRLNRRIEVVADPNLERGAVLFETVKGSLDASLETQLDEIERGLIDALGRRPS